MEKTDMRHVARSEILDYVTYEEQREQIRKHAMAEKAARRLHVADVLTLLFENTTTVRYQIQEMVRVERIVREADIQHEVDTYNELIGGAGELGCTMLIELDDPQLRAEKLREWLDLPPRVYVVREDGAKVYAKADDRQSDGERVSTVQYLKFAIGDRAPIAVGCDHPGLTGETKLTEEQRAALAKDLAATAA